MTAPVRSRASQTVWRWTAPAGRPAPEGRARTFLVAVLHAAPLALAGVALLELSAIPWLGRGALWLAALVAASGLVAPRVFLATADVARMAGRAFGLALTSILLTLVYAAVFVPGRLVLLLVRRDPLCRAFEKDRASYWTPRARPSRPEDFRRQY